MYLIRYGVRGGFQPTPFLEVTEYIFDNKQERVRHLDYQKIAFRFSSFDTEIEKITYLKGKINDVRRKRTPLNWYLLIMPLALFA